MSSFLSAAARKLDVIKSKQKVFSPCSSISTSPNSILPTLPPFSSINEEELKLAKLEIHNLKIQLWDRADVLQQQSATINSLVSYISKGDELIKELRTQAGIAKCEISLLKDSIDTLSTEKAGLEKTVLELSEGPIKHSPLINLCSEDEHSEDEDSQDHAEEYYSEEEDLKGANLLRDLTSLALQASSDEEFTITPFSNSPKGLVPYDRAARKKPAMMRVGSTNAPVKRRKISEEEDYPIESLSQEY